MKMHVHFPGVALYEKQMVITTWMMAALPCRSTGTFMNRRPHFASEAGANRKQKEADGTQ